MGEEDGGTAIMNVCMDLQAALGQRGGVGRYVRELFHHLGPTAQPGETLTGFYFDFHRRHTSPMGLEAWAGASALRACRWLPGRLAQGLWKHFHVPPYSWLAGDADLYHFPNFIRPPLARNRKSVVTIHDLSFLRMPETTEERNLAWLTAEIQHTADTADAILTDSRFSAAEIHECLGVESSRIFPVWLGLDSFPMPPPPEVAAATRRTLGLNRPYLLMVGTLEPRKNIPFLVKAFEAVNHPELELVLVGAPGWKTGPLLRAIEQSPCRARIRRLGGISDAELAAVYDGAALFVYPTRYEGFGFPPLEAMARGVPVLAARNSSLPEVLGDAPRWVDDFDASQWAAQIHDLLRDPAQRDSLRRAGLQQAARYTWDETARRTWKVYRHIFAPNSSSAPE